ncbi:MAG: CBS domain-containing protein [Bacteroidia bacterium]|nr:CBS domain-containing protein [Bacteroidia bacterium]NNC84586.1 CBS domain-containing protein [Bacteroidia bacterium]
MGEHQVKFIENLEQKKRFVHHLLNDVQAMDHMIKERMFEKGIQRVGSEQEFCVVDSHFRPSMHGPEVLDSIKDDHFTSEIARFNLEINLDPSELTTNCFAQAEIQLRELLEKAKYVASNTNDKILLAGILPTIRKTELELEYMTPNPRYYALNDALRRARGSDFELHIYGVDELTIKHQSVLFEGCNTSFQIHLQIAPEEFAEQYNWAQAIAGPLLSCATNSPLLLGKELWSETRIALFRQSIDIRGASYQIRQREPRVNFGNHWLKESITEIYKEDISRFTMLLYKEIEEESLEMVRNGNIPDLTALKLHNGTVYRWNRPCYGVADGVAHLRIENRYIPSGPTVNDEISNFAFWVGLMKGMPEKFKKIWNLMDIEEARNNFIKAARYGIESEFMWMGKQCSARELLRDELLPIARVGLQKVNIDKADIDKYLGIIERRINGVTSSQWMVRNFRNLKKNHSIDDSLVYLTSKIYDNQSTSKPVSEWENIADGKKHYINSVYERVNQIMTTDLYTVSENDLVELVYYVMQWTNISHMPVENKNDELVGIITKADLQENWSENKDESITVKELMVKEPMTVGPTTNVKDAKRIMDAKNIGCLPVIVKNKLVGIITRDDLLKIDL